MSIPLNELPWFRRPQSEARQPRPEMCNIQEAEQEVEFHRLESSRTQEPRQPQSAPCYVQDVEEQELKHPNSVPCITEDNKEQQVKHSQSVPCIAQNVKKHAAKLPKSVSFNVQGVEEKGEKLPQLAPCNTKDMGGQVEFSQSQFETFVEEQGAKKPPSEAIQDVSDGFKVKGCTRNESRHSLENQSSELLKMLKEAQLAFERETAREEKLASQRLSAKVEDLKGENRPNYLLSDHICFGDYTSHTSSSLNPQILVC